MELRKYVYSLLDDNGVSYVVSNASISSTINQGYPTVSLTLTGMDQIVDLVDAFTSKTLINKTFSLSINLPDIKEIVNLSSLIMNRITPGENINGYTATAYLIPQAAAFLSTYPAIFNRDTYKWTVKSLLKEIVTDYNNSYSNFNIKGFIYESRVDPIAITAPRFLNVPYWSMINQVAGRQGLVALLDFHSRLRIFSPISKTATKLRLSKHNVGNGNLMLDILQDIGS